MLPITTYLLRLLLFLTQFLFWLVIFLTSAYAWFNSANHAVFRYIGF